MENINYFCWYIYNTDINQFAKDLYPDETFDPDSDTDYVCRKFDLMVNKPTKFWFGLDKENQQKLYQVILARYKETS